MPDIMGDYNWSNKEYEPIRDEQGKPTGYHRDLKTGEVVTLGGPCSLHPPKGTAMSPWRNAALPVIT